MKTRKGLSKPAQSLWRETVKANSHLTEADSILLGIYCELVAELQKAIVSIAKTGATATSENGNEYLSASGQVVAMLTDKTTRLARELRITAGTRPKATSRPTTPTLKAFRGATG